MILDLHKGLHKSQSSVLIQLRSGKTGLAGFLHHRKVPGFDSPRCERGYHCETALHTLLHCPRYTDQRQALMHAGRIDKNWHLDTAQCTQMVIYWWIHQDILQQFSFAK